MIPQVGRGDLDPLGGLGGLGGIPGGGGMLFDPFGGRNFNPPDGQAFAGVPGRLPPYVYKSLSCNFSSIAINVILTL